MIDFLTRYFPITMSKKKIDLLGTQCKVSIDFKKNKSSHLLGYDKIEG